jgi:VIT1/CCC1 family predicted Fe2+/Mn2+ transporter
VSRKPRTERVPVALAEPTAGMQWLRDFRLSGFALTILLLVVAALVMLAPQLKTLVEQRQQIAQLEREVAAASERLEQIDSEVRLEQSAFENHPHAERAELVAMLVKLGMSRETAAQATEEIHRDEQRAVNFHLVQELGVDPSEKPSPWVAAISSFVMFAIGAIVPLIPYLLGYESLWAGVICGGIGLAIAGGVAARFTSRSLWWASLRQLIFGGVAIAATYLVGTLVANL